MDHHDFNSRSQVGQRLAAQHQPALQGKYEQTFRAQAKKARANYMGQGLTSSADPGKISPQIPGGIINESDFKKSVKARVAAVHKRMVAEVTLPILGRKPKPDEQVFKTLIELVAVKQSENAFLAAEDAVHSAILQGITDGLSVADTGKLIESVMTEWAPWQALRQAQTDLVSLANGASLESAKVLGDQAPQYKTWLTAGDGNVREAHADADGQTVPIDQPFDVGGFPMMYPGDPLAPDDLKINCRCTQIYGETANPSLSHTNSQDPLAMAAAGNPYHDAHGRFDFGAAQAADRAKSAKAMRDTVERDQPTTSTPSPQKELAQQTPAGQYNRQDYKIGDRVRTPLGAGTVKGTAYSGSQVGVQHDLGGDVSYHDPSELIREGSSAPSLPPREKGMQAAAVDFTSGTMIALYPAGPDRLSVPNGQPETDLHVTLCFLPNGVTGDRPLLVRVLSEIAYQTDVLSGVVGGMGMFAPGPDGAPIIALPDVPGLAEVRQQVVQALNGTSTEYAQNHGFTPHITIAYIGQGDNMVETPDLVGMPLEFRSLSLVEGLDRMDFPFREPDVDLVPGETADDQAMVDTMEPQDYLYAAAFTADQRKALAKKGEAMADGGFPIRNASDLSNAIHDFGRANDKAAVKAHIKTRARALGLTDSLPKDWMTASGEIEEDNTDDGTHLIDHVPVANIVYELEDKHLGRPTPEDRTPVNLPAEYDSMTASDQATEAAQRRIFLNSLATRGAHVLLEEESLLASAAPVHPPKEWFGIPEPDQPMPLTITADGQVMGHAAIWGSCHTGFPGRCTQPPTSPSGYSFFHTGALETDDGSTIPVGRLTFDGPHASMTASRAQAAAHYDNTCKVGAYVQAKDGVHGIWISGALKPGLTDADLQSLRAAAPSGDWRRPSPGSPLEMVGILGVNVAGYPVPRSLAASALLEEPSEEDSEVLALVAAGFEDTVHMADEYYERQLEVLGMLADGTLSDAVLTDSERRQATTVASRV